MTDALASLRPDWGDASSLEELWEKVRSPDFYPEPGSPGDMRRRLGYEAAVVKARAKRWLEAAEPGLSEGELYFRVERAYERWASARPSLRETQAVGRIFAEAEAENAWRDGRSSRGLELSRLELEHLAELLDGANHPLSASIAAKVAAVMTR